jgi:hypothetical protein
MPGRKKEISYKEIKELKIVFFDFFVFFVAILFYTGLA